MSARELKWMWGGAQKKASSQGNGGCEPGRRDDVRLEATEGD